VDRPPSAVEALAYTNPKVQRLRRLLGRRSARREHGAFVIEGATQVDDAVAAGWDVEAQFHAPGVDPRPGSPAFALAVGVAERVSATETPSGLLAIVRAPRPDPSLLTSVDFALVADRLTDPGNLGTIMRSAEAAGVGALVVTPGTVDVLNPKVVRASAGALFHVPVVEATLGDVADAGLRRIGTSSRRGVPSEEADWSGRIAVVVGSEAHGLEENVAIDAWVRVVHRGRAESLNVAMAATVVCFDAARHRAGG
jgi:TrmH family RNA methyltransferase